MAFTSATAVRQVDSHTYSANFQDDWCIGAVPHGGYVTATVQKVVKKHFETTLKNQDQPHTLALHLDFLRRTQTGPAIFTIKDVKLGRQTSVVHCTLHQDGRDEVVGYITNSHLGKEKGVAFDTHWEAYPERLPLKSTYLLESGNEPNWAELIEWPNANFRRATNKIRAWFPRSGQVRQNIYDMWVCLSDPSETWTNDKLGFLVDMFPQVCDSYVLGGADQYDPNLLNDKFGGSLDGYRKWSKGRVPFWYPTLLLNLDIKKTLPEGGAKFLFTRLQAKTIKNGRYDLEVIVLDESGEIVALSHHVCFALSAERNLAGRKMPKEEKL